MVEAKTPTDRMEFMKPPRRIKVDTAAAEETLTLSDPAIEVGRLIALLRGEGLTKITVQELLRPESAAKLQAILPECAFSGSEDRNPGPEHQPGGPRPEDGKVLVFKARETFRP